MEEDGGGYEDLERSMIRHFPQRLRRLGIIIVARDDDLDRLTALVYHLGPLEHVEYFGLRLRDQRTDEFMDAADGLNDCADRKASPSIRRQLSASNEWTRGLVHFLPSAPIQRDFAHTAFR